MFFNYHSVYHYGLVNVGWFFNFCLYFYNFIVHQFYWWFFYPIFCHYFLFSYNVVLYESLYMNKNINNYKKKIVEKNLRKNQNLKKCKNDSRHIHEIMKKHCFPSF